MVEMESVQCPYCGQSFELAVDTSVPAQSFVTDCEVCCRPWQVTAHRDGGRLRVEVAPAG